MVPEAGKARKINSACHTARVNLFRDGDAGEPAPKPPIYPN
jgi:hypothetical protein